MQLASEIQNGSREELIAYLQSWDVAYDEQEPDIVLRLAAQRNFQAAGPGAGPVQAVEDAGPIQASRMVWSPGHRLSFPCVRPARKP